MNHNAQSAFSMKKQLKIPVKVAGVLASQSGFLPFSKLQHPCKNSQSPELSFSIFCQINLTKLHLWVENIDNSSHSSKMGKIDKIGRGLALAGALVVAEPALAEDNSGKVHLASATTTEQVTNCVTFVKGQRELAKENGIKMSRREVVSLLSQCRTGELNKRIAEQEKKLKILRTRLAEQNITLDDQNQILDNDGRVLAKVISINGQWIIQRENLDDKGRNLDNQIAVSRARQQQILDEFERIIKELATS